MGRLGEKPGPTVQSGWEKAAARTAPVVWVALAASAGERGRLMDYMVRALDLAAQAKGYCNPNPAVGAVLVRDGRIVGEGATQPPGQAHAEIVALRAAGQQARESTLYVTLEPCSHHGLTGPCADAVVRAGVRRVQCAMLDPSPWVNGAGKRHLEAAGIGVEVERDGAAARLLNRDYFHWVDTGRPYVTAKWAMSLDGKIATRAGSARWITGSPARELVGSWRSAADVVMVGIGTALQDDPSLTARDRNDRLLARQPVRLVLDSRGRLPAHSRLASGKLPGRTLVATTPAGAAKLNRLLSDAVEIWVGEPGPDGRVQPVDVLGELGRRKLINVLVEAGGTLLATLLEQRLIDEVAAFVAPKLVGGRDAPTAIGGVGVDDMAAACQLVDVSFERVGCDILVRGRPG